MNKNTKIKILEYYYRINNFFKNASRIIDEQNKSYESKKVFGVCVSCQEGNNYFLFWI
jgi:hypothetical protein